MRGLWKAALLAPALVSAGWMVNDLQNQDITSSSIKVPVPGLAESPDLLTILSFHVDVLASDQICGYGNLTINGQELAQEPLEFASIGMGSIDVEGKSVEGSWTFFCLNGFYGPYAQRLDFTIVAVDGKAVEDITFWVEFKQNDGPKILSTSAEDEDSIIWEVLPDSEISDYEKSKPYDDYIDAESFDFESELAELEWMKDLVQEFAYRIYLKEEAMAMYHSQENLQECDSLKCVIRTVYSKARVTAHKVIGKVYSKISGETESEQDMRPPWKWPHGKRPHWGKPPFHLPPHGNHPHGNHTCPGKGNHTHPPFHPPPPPPPFCHCPPPPPHGPPPHGPPGKSPPPPHDGPSKPPGGPPGRRPGPPGDKPHGPPQPPPPPPPPLPPGIPVGMGHTRPRPGGDQGPPFPGSMDFNRPPFDGPHLGRKLYMIQTAAKLFTIAIIFLFIITMIRRRCWCSVARRQEKQARREERHRRRAFRRAARKHAWRSWFARHLCRSKAQDDLDEEEKRATLAGQSTEADSDAVASEICEFRNAVSVVSDMVAAEEGRAEGRVSMDSRATLPEYMSELGGEALPTYDDEQGTELSGVVADGFRYTPGSSEYTPEQSVSSSVRDVLGDVKE